MRVRVAFFWLVWLFAQPLLAQPTALEPNEHPAWTRLHQHFQALVHDPGARPLRILHFGDSHTAAAAFSGRLRELLQQRFGDSGPGFLPPGELPGHPQNHLRLSQSDGWVCLRERKPNAAGALGGFVAYSQRPYQFLSYHLANGNRDARLILYTDPERTTSHSRFKVFHDQKEVSPITRSLNGRAFYMLPSGNGNLDILSDFSGATPRLRGLSLLYQIPGVSYSALGVNGASFSILQEWQGATVRMQISDYQPDLLLLAFGTNDVLAPAFSRDSFIRTLKTTEGWISEYASHAAVLMIMPPDLPWHDVRVQENLSTLRQQIRIFARKNGWFVWDWSHAIDSASRSRVGPGAYYAQDGIHLTATGYSQSAKELIDALGVVF